MPALVRAVRDHHPKKNLVALKKHELPVYAYVYGLAPRFPLPVTISSDRAGNPAGHRRRGVIPMNVKTLLTTALAVVVGMVAYTKFVQGKI